DGVGPASIWFYRTSDAGRTWLLTKVPTGRMAVGANDAAVGPVWWVTGLTGSPDFTASSDSGATWSTRTPSGLPFGDPIWFSFVDATHAAAVARPEVDSVLLLSSDGGRTWRTADFDDGRAKVPGDPFFDSAAVQSLAMNFM